MRGQKDNGKRGEVTSNSEEMKPIIEYVGFDQIA
jgi:hypothetical protein